MDPLQDNTAEATAKNDYRKQQIKKDDRKNEDNNFSNFRIQLKWGHPKTF